MPIIESPSYTAGERGTVAALDASASYDSATNILTMFLVNRQQDEELTVTITLADRQWQRVLSAEVMGGGDVKAAKNACSAVHGSVGLYLIDKARVPLLCYR